jgi:hypothetical protein
VRFRLQQLWSKSEFTALWSLSLSGKSEQRLPVDGALYDDLRPLTCPGPKSRQRQSAITLVAGSRSPAYGDSRNVDCTSVSGPLRSVPATTKRERQVLPTLAHGIR